ncbi:MAG: hypothetical protein R3F19_06270 [Verrucomicrobiales bacterium]
MPCKLRILLVGWLAVVAALGETEPSASISQLQHGRYAGFWGWRKISALYEVVDVDEGHVSCTVDFQ